jgi:hypothetical protein
VHYGQAYVLAGGANPELPEAFAGRENGLCGAALPGSLFLITGLHTGDVGLAVDVHDEPPPIDESWEEIVEATFVATTAEAALVEWGEADGARLDLRPGDWRARYSARGMDAAHERTRHPTRWSSKRARSPPTGTGPRASGQDAAVLP